MPLDCQAEWLYPLEGLPFPEETDDDIASFRSRARIS